MLYNNYSGALQTVAKVDTHFWEFQVMLHTDDAEAVREFPMDLIGSLVESDTMTLVGHKFGASKVISALYIQPGCLAEGGKR